MINSLKDLHEYLISDSINYKSQVCNCLRRIKCNLFSNPISEQKYIWLYIKALRYVEYYQNKPSNLLNKLLLLWWLSKLRKYSHITSFQIPPNVCGCFVPQYCNNSYWREAVYK